MGDISELKRGQIVGAYLAGSCVTDRGSSICGVWRTMAFRVMSAYHHGIYHHHQNIKPQLVQLPPKLFVASSTPQSIFMVRLL